MKIKYISVHRIAKLCFLSVLPFTLNNYFKLQTSEAKATANEQFGHSDEHCIETSLQMTSQQRNRWKAKLISH